MPEEVIRFRPGADLAGWLEDRRERMLPPPPSASLQARAELQAWRHVLAAELSRVLLTLAQARCVAGVIGGPQMRPGAGEGAGRVFAACYAAFGLARRGPHPDLSSFGDRYAPEGENPLRWEQELLAYLGSLTPAADCALEDAMCRWWAHVQPRDGLPREDGGEWRADSAEGFALAGLSVTEDRP